MVQRAGAVGLGLLAIRCGGMPFQSRAPAPVPRIGWLSPGFQNPSGPSLGAPGPLDAFRDGLRELGYVEGQNIAIDARYGEESPELLVERAAELTRVPVDVIVAFGAPSPLAARRATQTIPVVMLGGPPQPLEAGLIESYARPGGNVTGSTALPSGAIGGKYLELLKAAAPGVSKVARLFDVSAGSFAGSAAEQTSNTAAQVLGVQVHVLEVQGPGELEGALEAARREGADALTVTGTPLFIAHARRIADVALQYGWPAIAPWRLFVEAGILMSYGTGALPVMARRAAVYVDKILRGTSPAVIPVEQPTTFDFIVNLKTARALGLTIPQHVLLQATEIIQ